ncbi:2-C-methyl-D-erythritol 4-phosphate cytidylyltransferase [Arthrobacter sp. zg-Y40]|uniref:2-C-methyl-D-erythritol 4-phosphate cytidylyltransferase n=1 Tax=Arthrobacter sp. zg-Y40 TaxID=2886939 RepID=UPI001D13E5D2|nr:2-C-methyl-D-erythritol 4-phosphate cytidylyltransferase [Arthrobacter sp. zg-Y40]
MSPSFSSPRRIGVVVVAGGSGQRLGYGIPKAAVPLAGEPMLAHTLRAVSAAGIASAVVVAVPAGDYVMRGICAAPEFTAPGCPDLRAVDGGASRPESVRAALAVLPQDLDAVLVHDAARALTPPEVFLRVAAALADGAQAVIPAVPVVDTIKDTEPVQPAAGAGAARRVTGTPDRSRLRAVQTPQGFEAALLRRAHDAALSFDEAQAASVTDDAMLAESLGVEVYVVEGSQLSLKITTPLDMVLAEAILSGGYRHPEN